MRSFKKSALFFAVLICALLTAFPAFGQDEEPVKHGDCTYYITDYNVRIDVGEDNTLAVKEQISAYFNKPSHGIFRNIPYSGYIEREDGTSAKMNARVRDIAVSEVADVSTRDGECVIRIGDKYETVSGSRDYTISYNYVIGEDTGEGFDELYYNIIGTEWNTYIDNVTFTVNMPKEFDEKKLGFSAGKYGSVGTTDIEYSVNGNTINGRLTKELSPYQGLTVRLELPDNYFYFNYAAYYAKLSLLVLIPALALALVIILWVKYGRDKKVVDVVEFYPPEGMSSLEVAYWYKGAASQEDVIPLLIELANEGFIEIIQDNYKTESGNISDFTIKRVKDYDGGNEYKQIFFDGLFGRFKDKVYKTDLENSFYIYIERILTKINDLDNKTKVFGEKSLNMRIAGWASAIIALLASFFISSRIVGGTEKYVFLLIGSLICLFAFIFAFFIRQRTNKGHEILQKINGFKIFLEKAEKERLEKLVYENPEYYYDILPYAYVLGVSDAWTKNFEGIASQPPEWYSSTGVDFGNITCAVFLNNMLRTATASMTAQPHEDSGILFSGGGGISGGGGFSGGGFSGGGFGGGGGGSW